MRRPSRLAAPEVEQRLGPPSVPASALPCGADARLEAEPHFERQRPLGWAAAPWGRRGWRRRRRRGRRRRRRRHQVQAARGIATEGEGEGEGEVEARELGLRA